MVCFAAEDLVARIKEGEREEGGGDALLGNSSDATLHLVHFPVKTRYKTVKARYKTVKTR